MDKESMIKQFKEHDCDIEAHDFFNLKVILLANGNQFHLDPNDYNNRLLKIDFDKGFLRIRDNYQGIYLETDVYFEQIQGFSFLSKDQGYLYYPKDKDKYEQKVKDDIARLESER